MREMKNSGIEWIGEIPKDWKLGKAKRFIRITNGSNPTIEGNIPVYGSGKKPFATCGNYKSGSAVLLGRKGTIDNPTYIEGLYWNVDTVFDVKVTRDDFLIKYYYYLSTCFDYKFYMTQTAIPSMTQTNYNNIFIPFPPLSEQTTIASYLDKKCSNIDAIITKNEQIIEKLKEYKSSLITETVTKGLNPDVKMKNSGVEWIGEIPAEWSYGRIKYNYYLKGRIGWQGLKASEFIDDGPYLVTGTDFINGEINWESCYHISEERYNEAPEIHVKVGDLLITKDGTVGKVAFIKTKPDKVSLNSHLLIMRSLNNSYSNRFLFWIIQSNVFELYFQLTQSGSIMASLSQEKINNFSFPLPPLSEQIAIASYLDEKCSIIDSNIAKRELINAKLAEYKKSLIYEVVTGKKEV